MLEVQVLDNAIAEIKHNIRNEKENACISNAKIEAWESTLFDLQNHREAIINRANNRPAPSDVISDAPKGY